MTPSKTQGPTAERERAAAGFAGRPDTAAGPVEITVNGKRRTMADAATIGDLLRELDLDHRMIVVEHNGQILRHDVSAPAHVLHMGDVVELVHFVGGG
jgi:thiamine biosynthesis protein ThiS